MRIKGLTERVNRMEEFIAERGEMSTRVGGFDKVEPSPHSIARYLQRIESKFKPHSLDDQEKASSALQALFLSGKWRIATHDEVQTYFQRGEFRPSERVLSTEHGFFLVSIAGRVLTIVTMCDELSNMLVRAKPNGRRRGRRRR
jgi:hypothetical protein